MGNKQHAPSSWPEWFNRAAEHFEDPRVKMAYIVNIDSGAAVPEEVMQSVQADIWGKLQAKPEHRVLDVGCGVGYFHKYNGRKVKEVIGTDVSAPMIATAKQLNPQGKFLVAASDNLPFEEDSFERLVCYSVFHYAGEEKDAARTLDEFRRVTKPGGVILVGDIVPPQDKKSPAESSGKKRERWWPEALDHELKKLRLEPRFFKEYATRHGCRVEILEQHIPGRETPDKRYDVRIKNK